MLCFLINKVGDGVCRQRKCKQDSSSKAGEETDNTTSVTSTDHHSQPCASSYVTGEARWDGIWKLSEGGRMQPTAVKQEVRRGGGEEEEENCQSWLPKCCAVMLAVFCYDTNIVNRAQTLYCIRVRASCHPVGQSHRTRCKRFQTKQIKGKISKC